MTTRSNEEARKVSLTAAIQTWLDDDASGFVLPWVGGNIAEIMAQAALSVMRGIEDAQDYLRDNGMLDEDAEL